MTGSPGLHRPPAPRPRGDARTLFAVLFGREFDLLRALSRSSYEIMMGRRSFLGRRVYLVNDPVSVREILVDKAALYPKADAFVDALSPLVGEGVFTANGDAWRRGRATIRPALSQMSLRSAFPHMRDAAEACAERWDRAAATGEPLALDAEMSHVTADAVVRTLFSQPIDGAEARAVFDAFATVQTLSDQLSMRRMLYALGSARPSRPEAFDAACGRIREAVGRMVDRGPPGGGRDVAAALAAAIDPATGRAPSRRELVDQVATFVLAGHETTASLLTWTLAILSEAPGAAERVRAEIDAMDETPTLDAVQNGAPFLRDVLKETLRLYPPVGFLLRTPREPDEIRQYPLRPRDLVAISPWVMGRHRQLWRDPDGFDPDRFSPERAGAIVRDAFIPFGLGPRACPGAAFATVESTLILARLLRRFAVTLLDPDAVRPVARLTVRPGGAVMVRVSRR